MRSFRQQRTVEGMRSFTDIFIKHPVLAVVVNLVIVLVGWRALTMLPVQQYPSLESALTHDFCYPSRAVASRILLPVGWSDGSGTWRGKSAWPHAKS
jgi:hypothetical protein